MKKRGSVLIVGGGIGGMQAALDIADSGFKVYMAEKGSTIGGTMVRLDKTFPTGDCAMCMISPKMVEVGRHPNINIKSMTDVLDVKGEPGRFTIKLREKARAVDPEKCTGCGECTRSCPVHHIIQMPARLPLPQLKPEWEENLNKTYEEHRGQRKALIAMLQSINARFGYLPREVLAHLADRLTIPVSEVLRVATFYNAFSLIPVGRHIIELCSGTACHVKGSSRLLDWLKSEMQIDVGQTSSDMRFTLRTVNCLGCCALAPAVKVDGETYGYVKIAELPAILKDHP